LLTVLCDVISETFLFHSVPTVNKDVVAQEQSGFWTNLYNRKIRNDVGLDYVLVPFTWHSAIVVMRYGNND